MGETLMRATDPEKTLRDLIAEFEARSATGRIRRGEQITPATADS
jgi:hypothetical protein